MPTPLIAGPYPRPKTFQRYPAPHAGSVLVARRGHGFEVLAPPSEAGFLKAMRLGEYYVARRHSGLHEDVHRAPARDSQVQFRFTYSFALELRSAAESDNDQTTGVCEELKRNAIKAVRYYSEHADPVLILRARLRQKLNDLARQHTRPDIGPLYDRLLELQRHGCDDLPETNGIRVCLEEFSVAAEHEGFGHVA